MAFGIDINGFTLKRISDILEEVEQDEIEAFGNIDVSAESVFGQLNGTFTNQCAEIWEQLENSYLSTSPVNAEGATLDYVVSQNGVERLSSLPTTVNVGLKGTTSTVIPAGTQAKNSSTGEIFELQADTEINDQDQIQTFIKVETAADNTVYAVGIGPSLYEITTPGSGNTPDTVALQLTNDILADSTRVVEPDQLIDGVIKIDVDLSLTPNFDADILAGDLSYFTPSLFKSVNTGEVLAVRNTINIIETPVFGLDELNNFIDGDTGRGPETDAELRIRREDSLQIVGAGTLEAITARVLDDVDGVILTRGFENRTDVTDGDGRPPHSIEIVVDGGADQDIGDKLWEVKGGGIGTFGDSTATVTDSNGDLQSVHFTRPVDVDIYVGCELTLYSEEDFPADGISQVEQTILDYGDSLEIGTDVISQRFIGPVFTIPGIENVDIEISKIIPPPYTGGSKISIASSEVSKFDLARIDVSIP